MSAIENIDDLIRFRLRRIRRNRKLKMREVADRAGMPLSTYSSIENGGTRSIKAARLFQILEAMGATAEDVWPYANIEEILELERDRDLSHQEFRIYEFRKLVDAHSAILLLLEDARASILLTSGLTPETALRVAVHLESGSEIGENAFELRIDRMRFVLAVSECSKRLGQPLIDYFIETFADAFAADSLLLEAAKNRHPQP